MKKNKLYLGIIFLIIIFFLLTIIKEKKITISPQNFQKNISKIYYLDDNYIIFNEINNDNYIYNFNTKSLEKLTSNIDNIQIVKVLDNKKIVYLKNGEIYLNDKKKSNLNNIKNISFRDDLFIINSNEKYGVLNTDLETIIPFDYDFVEKGQQLFLAKKDNKMGYIDNKNNIVIPFEYEIATLDENKNFIALKNNQTGVTNLKNNTLIEFKYDNFIRFSNKFIGYKDKAFHLLDEKLNKKLDATWLGFPSKDTIFYEKNGKFGLLDINGNKITENIYDELGQQNVKAIIFKKDNKYGLINQKGKIIYKNIADYIVPLSKYFFTIGIDGEDSENIVNSNGNTILKNENFIEIFEINENYLLAQTLDDFTLFDKNGTKLLTIKEIIFFNNSIIIYKKDNQIFYIRF